MENLNYGIENGKVHIFNQKGKLRCQNCQNGLGIRNNKTFLMQTSVSLLNINESGEIDLILRCGQCKNLTTIPIEVQDGKLIYKKFDRKLNI
jgi:ribosomal protein L33